ncbi:protein of unknown function [Azospirillum baldaniorum]|uniref:HPt domain-containing protein n=1 Tax=Azospirillum baldaniorum TaxID=1064539 RepID=A0A9P1JTI6_9PROT|nr:protein of unknown function [Azospirillum baldaniorum]
MEDLSRFKQTYFDESAELLEVAESGLLRLTPGEVDSDEVNAIFRAVHSIKGGGGAFGFTELVAFAHEFETVMDGVRNNTVPVTTELVDTLIRANDLLGQMLAYAREGDPAPAGTTDGTVAALRRHLSGGAPQVQAPAAAPAAPAPAPTYAPTYADDEDDEAGLFGDAMAGHRRRPCGGGPGSPRQAALDHRLPAAVRPADVGQRAGLHAARSAPAGRRHRRMPHRRPAQPPEPGGGASPPLLDGHAGRRRGRRSGQDQRRLRVRGRRLRHPHHHGGPAPRRPRGAAPRHRSGARCHGRPAGGGRRATSQSPWGRRSQGRGHPPASQRRRCGARRADQPHHPRRSRQDRPAGQHGRRDGHHPGDDRGACARAAPRRVPGASGRTGAAGPAHPRAARERDVDPRPAGVERLLPHAAAGPRMRRHDRQGGPARHQRRDDRGGQDGGGEPRRSADPHDPQLHRPRAGRAGGAGARRQAARRHRAPVGAAPLGPHRHRDHRRRARHQPAQGAVQGHREGARPAGRHPVG